MTGRRRRRKNKSVFSTSWRHGGRDNSPAAADATLLRKHRGKLFSVFGLSVCCLNADDVCLCLSSVSAVNVCLKKKKNPTHDTASFKADTEPDSGVSEVGKSNEKHDHGYCKLTVELLNDPTRTSTLRTKAAAVTWIALDNTREHVCSLSAVHSSPSERSCALWSCETVCDIASDPYIH